MIHRHMGPGGLLGRAAGTTGRWTSLRSASDMLGQNVSLDETWCVGHDPQAEDRPFLGADLTRLQRIADLILEPRCGIAAVSTFMAT